MLRWNGKTPSGRPLMRALALFLAFALCLPMLPLGVFALPLIGDGKLPVITLDGNVVVDSQGKPTGFFELGIRVMPGEDPMASLVTYLTWNADLLRPVTWVEVEDADGNVAAVPITVEASASAKPFPTSIPTKRIDTLTTMEAFAGVETIEGKKYSRLELLMGFKRGDALSDVSEEETAAGGRLLGVVRFQFIEKAANTGEADDVIIPMPLETVKGFVVTEPKAEELAPRFPYVVDYTGNSAAFFAGFDATFNPMPTLSPAGRSASQHVWYETAASDAGIAYWTPEFYGVVEEEIDSKEDIKGKRPGNVNSEGLLTARENLIMQLRSGETFALAGGVQLENLSTILFYDLQNNLIGALTTPKGDARELVNSYVEENFVHENLRLEGKSEEDKKAQLASLDRKDTYRGKYKHITPTEGTEVTDGESYALTAYLDYAFLRRVGAVDRLDPAQPKWVQGTAANGGNYDLEYPWTHGWALCQPGAVADTWTTIGTGELEIENGSYLTNSANGDKVTAAAGASFLVNDGMSFDIADFSDLQESVYYVKMIVEPGGKLDTASFYSVIPDVSYMRYGVLSSTQMGNAYEITFAYERVNSDGYGIYRMRDPSFRATFAPDVNGEEKDGFFVEALVENTEIVDVAITSAASIYGFEYNLVDKYSNPSFAVSTARSVAGDELGLLKNFDYGNYSYKNRLGTFGYVYIATLNQILDLAYRAYKENPDPDDQTEYASSFDYYAFQDLNIQYSATTIINSAEYAALARDRLATLFTAAYEKGVDTGAGIKAGEAGVKSLEWHQLQYHIINFASGGALDGDGKVMSPTAVRAAYAPGFDWCRNAHGQGCGCASTSQPVIDSWENFIAALPGYVEDPRTITSTNLPPEAINGDAADAIYDLWLRKEDGATFGSTAEFAALLPGLQAALEGNQGVKNDPQWEYIQFYLINGYFDDKTVMATEAATYYWWKNGGEPVTDVETLVAAIQQAADDNWAPLNSTTDANISGAPFYFRVDAANEWTAATRTDLVTRLKAVLTGKTPADVTWDQIQYYLLNGDPWVNSTVAAAESDKEYWWKGGGQQVTSWATLMTAISKAYGTNGADGSEAMLRSVSDISFINGAPIYLRKANGAEFASIDEFILVAKAAAGRFAASGVNIETQTAAQWDDVQYYFLNSESYVNDSRGKAASDEFYWWKGGGARVADFAALRTALDNYAKNGIASGLNSMYTRDDTPNSTPVFLSGNTKVDTELRSSKRGTEYTSLAGFVADMKELAMAVQAAIDANTVADLTNFTTLSITRVQHYLDHRETASDGDYTALFGSENYATGLEAQNFYWWMSSYGRPAPIFENDTPTEKTVDEPTDMIDNLLTAAWLKAEYDNDKVLANWSSSESDYYVDFYRFVQDDDADAHADMTSFADDGELMEALVDDVMAGTLGAVGADPLDLTWWQVQEMLLDDVTSYISHEDDWEDDEDHWWRIRDTEEPQEEITGVTILNDLFTRYLKDSTATAADFVTWYEADFVTGTEDHQLGVKRATAGTAFSASQAVNATSSTGFGKRMIVDFMDEVKANPSAYSTVFNGEKIELGWYQIAALAMGRGFFATEELAIADFCTAVYNTGTGSFRWSPPDYVTPKLPENGIWPLSAEGASLPLSLPTMSATEEITYSEDGTVKTTVTQSTDDETGLMTLTTLVETPTGWTQTVTVINLATGETKTTTTVGAADPLDPEIPIDPEAPEVPLDPEIEPEVPLDPEIEPEVPLDPEIEPEIPIDPEEPKVPPEPVETPEPPEVLPEPEIEPELPPEPEIDPELPPEPEIDPEVLPEPEIEPEDGEGTIETLSLMLSPALAAANGRRPRAAPAENAFPTSQPWQTQNFHLRILPILDMIKLLIKENTPYRVGGLK